MWILLALVVVAVAATLMWMRRNPLVVHAWSTRRALARSGFQKRSFDAPKGRVVWWEAGDGSPLVFLHGAGDQAGAWSQVAPAFTDRYRVLVPDLPGHGASAPATGPLPFSTVLEGTAAILDREVTEPTVLVGASMGAWLAFLRAAEQPERVARVVAVNGGPLRGEAEVSLVLANREAARRLLTLLRDPASPPIPDFVLDDIARTSQRGPIGRLAADAAGMEGFLLDEAHLGEISVPVDLLWGSSDQVLPLAYAERLAAALPRARITPIPHCGHVPANECPERFRQALGEVLATPPPGPGEEGAAS